MGMMRSRRGNRQRYIRWIAVFCFCCCSSFAVVVLSQPGDEETNSTIEPPTQPTEKPIPVNSQDESVDVAYHIAVRH